MFLWRDVTLENTSPSPQNINIKNQENPNNNYFHSKGISAVFSFAGRGSMTVEAAVVLPIFLFALFTLIYVGEIIRLSANDQEKLMQNAMKMSTYAYSFDGILPESQILDLKNTWTVNIPFVPTPVRGVRITDRARVRAFTGYDNIHHRAEDDTEDITVFVTDYGRVYHTTRTCHHLQLSIRSIGRAEVSGERNLGGHRYYPCERCASRAGSRVYITGYGDSYHADGRCPGLKRGIHAMRLSEVDGLPPCSDCGR